MASDKFTIYHNPGCSKSREALHILEQNNVTPTVVEYLDNPPSKNEIADIIKMLGDSSAELLRTSEAAYKNAGYDINTMTNTDIINAIDENPSLLQRPIIVYRDKVVIGRPPSKVLDIIPDRIL